MPKFRVSWKEAKLPEVKTDTQTFINDDESQKFDENDFSEIFDNLGLLGERQKEAAKDLTEFLVNVANNPYVQNARSYIPSPEVLFPKVDEETQKWAEGVAQQQEEIMNNFGFNNQQNSTPNPFESFTNQMMHSAQIIGQIFNNAANNYNYDEVD